MRALAGVCVVTIVTLAVPEAAQGKIAFLRGTIVSVGYTEHNGAVFGSITVARSSPANQKRETIRALITKQTRVSGSGLGGPRFALKDLKPGMAVELTVSGNRTGEDRLWRADSIRVIDLAGVLRP
jgi:hypothetical protein